MGLLPGARLFPEGVRSASLDELPAVLGEVDGFLARYVHFPSPEARVPLALFVPLGYALLEDPEAVPAAPYVSVTSPAPECGKSRCLECLHKLLGDERALFVAGSITPAALFRSRERPIVLLIDEVGRLFARRDDVARELAGILDNGYRRGATVPRAVPFGKDFVVRRWPVFGPAVLAGLGDLPDSTRSRVIRIVLSRRPPDARVAPFFEADAEPVAAGIRSRLAALAPALGRALRGRRPDLGALAGLRDRTQEAWWGLLGVAELAGEAWAMRARAAALALHGAGADVEPDRRVLLLRALKEVFDEANTEKLPTLDVLRYLVEREHEPWPGLWGDAVEAAVDRGRPPRRAGADLARHLKGFGVAPRTLKMPDGGTSRGYLRADLEEAWRIYLSRDDETVNPSPGGDVTNVTDVTVLPAGLHRLHRLHLGGEEGLTDAGTSNGEEVEL